MEPTTYLSPEIWSTIIEQFYKEFPDRISALRLVSRLCDVLIIPLRYRNITLTDHWLHSPHSVLHETISDRVTSYSTHVTFEKGLPSSFPRIQHLLNQCRRLQSITWGYTICPPGDGPLVHLPDELRDFISTHPNIAVHLHKLLYSRIRNRIPPNFVFTKLQGLEGNIESIDAIDCGSGFGTPDAHSFISTCTRLSSLSLNTKRATHFMYVLGPRLPPIKYLALKNESWKFQSTDEYNKYDFSNLEEFVLSTKTPLCEILNSFKSIPAPNLRVLRYGSLAVPTKSLCESSLSLGVGAGNIPGLRVLELRYSNNRIDLPEIFEHFPKLKELDVGLQSGFKDKRVGVPILNTRDVEYVRNFRCLETLAIDLERDFCNTYAFLSTLCQIPALRTLLIRTQTVLRGEYTVGPQVLDIVSKQDEIVAKEDENDPDRLLAIMMTKSVHRNRSHRLAKFIVKLGGYEEDVDWVERDVQMVDGALERRMFVGSWNLWSKSSEQEILFEEQRGRKIVRSLVIRYAGN